MKILDPDNEIERFENRASNVASTSFDKLLGRMEEREKNQGPIKRYFRSKSAFGYNWWYLIWHPWVIVREVWEEITFAWQRALRGWDDRQTWGVDYSYSKILGELILRFKELNNAVPIPVIEKVTGEEYVLGEKGETPEQFQEACDLWDDILEEMAEGFLYYHEHKYDYDYENYNEHEKILSKKIERSLELFSEYFRHIWW